MRNWQLPMAAAGLALGLAVGAGSRAAAPTGGGLPASQANPNVDPTPELALDEQTLAKATARGEAMLKAARWEVNCPNGTTLFDAGDAVISERLPSSPSSNGYAVDKATGKSLWPATSMRVMAAAVSEKGAEVVVERAVGPLAGPLQAPDTQPLLSMINRPPSGTQSSRGAQMARGEGMVMDMMSVADRTSRWQVPWEPYVDSVLFAPHQLFTGAAAPLILRDVRNGRSLYSRSLSTPLEVRAFDRATGKKQWSYPLPEGTIYTRTLTFADGILYVVAVAPDDELNYHHSTVIALNGADGKRVFTLPQPGVSPITLTNGVAVLYTSAGEVVGLDAKTGKEQWRERISFSKEPGRVPLTKELELDEAPVVAGDTIVVPVRGTTDPPPYDLMAGLAAFDIKTHKQLWFFRPPEDTATDTGGSGFNGMGGDYPGRKLARQLCLRGVQVEKGEIVALAEGSYAEYVGVDVKTGKLEWLLPTEIVTLPGSAGVTKPLVSNGILYVANAATGVNAKLLAIPLETPK